MRAESAQEGELPIVMLWQDLKHRAKAGATVSMPLTWKQIEKGVKISDFTIRNVPKLLEKNGDAWKEFLGSRQELKLN